MLCDEILCQQLDASNGDTFAPCQRCHWHHYERQHEWLLCSDYSGDCHPQVSAHTLCLRAYLPAFHCDNSLVMAGRCCRGKRSCCKVHHRLHCWLHHHHLDGARERETVSLLRRVIQHMADTPPGGSSKNLPAVVTMATSPDPSSPVDSRGRVLEPHSISSRHKGILRLWQHKYSGSQRSAAIISRVCRQESAGGFANNRNHAGASPPVNGWLRRPSVS